MCEPQIDARRAEYAPVLLGTSHQPAPARKQQAARRQHAARAGTASKKSTLVNVRGDSHYYAGEWEIIHILLASVVISRGK
jgi:hypothetical protein